MIPSAFKSLAQLEVKVATDDDFSLGIDDKPHSYVDAAVIWAGPATTAGLPATVMPIDQSDDGLPIGVQIVGPYLEDRTTIAFAALLEREFGGFVAPLG